MSLLKNKHTSSFKIALKQESKEKINYKTYKYFSSNGYFMHKTLIVSFFLFHKKTQTSGLSKRTPYKPKITLKGGLIKRAGIQ